MKPVAAIDRAMEFVDTSRDVVGDKPMFVNLTLDAQWLSDKQLRAVLLQPIVDSPEKHWYLRFWWPMIANRYGQLTDKNVLDGYRVLSRTAALERKRLFLPNAGLTGWVMTGLGATGFSTGTSWTDQAFARERRMGGVKGRPSPPRIPRMFDRALLHTVEFGRFERLQTVPG